MSESNSTRNGPLDLELLRAQHLADSPSPAAHAELLAKIVAKSETRSNLTQAPESVPQKKLGGFSAQARILMAALVLAGGAGLVLLVNQKPRTPIHPEPLSPVQAALPPLDPALLPALPPAPKPAAPCWVANGNLGQLLHIEQPKAVKAQLKLPLEHSLLIPELDGRRGAWFHARHTTGEDGRPEPLEVLPPRRNPYSKANALKFAGPAPSGWGANFGVRLDACYDASAYAGIEFRARGAGALWVGFHTPDSVPVEFGGNCVSKCWFTAGRTVTLSNRFTSYRIGWSDVHSPSGERGFESRILQVTFSVQSGPTPYDVWLDELKFVPIPAGAAQPGASAR
jgi:hypothetical protein